MDKYETRRKILDQILHDRCGGKVAILAAKIDRAPSYVSRMLYPQGKDGAKRIGDDMVELLSKTFDVDMAGYHVDSSPVSDSSSKAPELQTTYIQRINQDELELLESYRLTPKEEREPIKQLLELLPKIDLPYPELLRKN